MGRKYLAKKRRDTYYRRAKKEGYRSRAAYKLIQINKKFGVIRNGDAVVDLGASPGGWSQVVKEIVGDNGKVIAVDMHSMKTIEGVEFIKGDIRSEETIERIMEKLPNGCNVVISDMSPNISGNYSIDHARSIELCDAALECALKILKKNGNFVIKVFQGDMLSDYLNKLNIYFKTVRCHSPKASRKRSSEIYVIGRRFMRDENNVEYVK